METFHDAYQTHLRAEADYDGASEDIPQAEDVWLETAFRDAFTAVIRAPIASTADAVAALTFCRAEMLDATKSHLLSLQEILGRAIVYMTASNRQGT